MEELALHVLDLAQNSLAAGATLVIIIINEDTMTNRLTIGIEDNGRGMRASLLSRCWIRSLLLEQLGEWG